MKVFTGKVPFDDKAAPAVIKCIMDGEHPSQPDHPNFTELLWKLVQKCWKKEPQDRPKTQDVMRVLNGLSAAILDLYYEYSAHS